MKWAGAYNTPTLLIFLAGIIYNRIIYNKRLKLAIYRIIYLLLFFVLIFCKPYAIKTSPIAIPAYWR